MGRPKHLLRHQSSGQPLLHWQWQRLAPHFARSLILSGSTELEVFEDGIQVTDPQEFVGQGPLAALLSALESVQPDSWVAVLAVENWSCLWRRRMEGKSRLPCRSQQRAGSCSWSQQSLSSS